MPPPTCHKCKALPAKPGDVLAAFRDGWTYDLLEWRLNPPMVWRCPGCAKRRA